MSPPYIPVHPCPSLNFSLCFNLCVSFKLNNEMKAVRETTGGLAGELGKLLSVVQTNRSELDSHVKSSQAFIRMAADQQVLMLRQDRHPLLSGPA